MSHMIQNAVYVPSQRRYYVSSHRHDFVSFEVKGEEHFIDGGRDYRRSSFRDHKDIVDYSLTTADSLDTFFEKLLWGTFGKKGKSPLAWKPIRNLSASHLEAILKTQPVNGLARDVVEYWLKRKSQPAFIQRMDREERKRR